MEIKSKIRTFLRDELRLELSESKTLLTHATTGAGRFGLSSVSLSPGEGHWSISVIGDSALHATLTEQGYMTYTSIVIATLEAFNTPTTCQHPVLEKISSVG